MATLPDPLASCLEYTLFGPLVCLCLLPRSLHACTLVKRSWTATLSDEDLWSRLARMLPPSPSMQGRGHGPAGYKLFALARRVRCSPSVPLRLSHPDDATTLRLYCSPHNEGCWRLGLKDEAEVLMDLGCNWDTLTQLFGRGAGVLRHELQTSLGEVMLDSDWLRHLSSFLPSHDYQVAAFPVRPTAVDAPSAFNHVFAPPNSTEGSVPESASIARFGSRAPSDGGCGWTELGLYRHDLAPRATHCATHLLLAPLHPVHDQDAVSGYEAMIKEGQRPVVLALCVGLPYNKEFHSGMPVDVHALLGYSSHDREIANFRAILQRAEAEAAAGAAGMAAGSLPVHAAEAARRLRAELSEYEDEGRISTHEQAEQRRAALDCRAFSFGGTADEFVRLGLLLILDGHHKMRAAANLGAAVTVLCYGLQGQAATCFDMPYHEGTLLFDSEAIYEAIAHDHEGE